VIVGEEDIPDFSVSPSNSRAMKARKVIIPGVGHMSKMEAPKAVNAATIEFLDEICDADAH
jgi:pimeloyl-ACP methyl ester carboxylesterase